MKVGYASIGKIKLRKIIVQINIDENLKKIYDREFLLKFSRGGA
jgi:hypothetical protein